MNCPHCQKRIDDKIIARHFASRGGKLSKRELDTVTAKKMVAAREKKRAERKAQEKS